MCQSLRLFPISGTSFRRLPRLATFQELWFRGTAARTFAAVGALKSTQTRDYALPEKWRNLAKYGGKRPNCARLLFLTTQISVFLVSYSLHIPIGFRFVCGPPPPGPQTNWKASGKRPFFRLRRRRRPRRAAQLVVSVGGPTFSGICTSRKFAPEYTRVCPILPD